jgi:hypothetical protein
MDLAEQNQQALTQSIDARQEIPEIYRKKVLYLIRIYNILQEKYSFGITNLEKTLHRSNLCDKDDVTELLSFLDTEKWEKSLAQLFVMMKKLVNVIFSTEPK